MDKDAVLVNLSGVEVFVSLSSHVFDPSADETHIRVLVKAVSPCASQLFDSHHIGTSVNDDVVGDKVRQQECLRFPV